jgi:hypothetical protein
MYIVKETQLNSMGVEVETLDDEFKKSLSQSFIILLVQQHFLNSHLTCFYSIYNYLSLYTAIRD